MWIVNPPPRIGLLLLLLSAALFSTSSYALTCKRANDGSVEQLITLDHQINVSTANLAPNTVLWRSQTFTSTFKCTDTNNHPKGEDAYLWWDPDRQMSAIHNSLEVGVTFLGSDINPTKIKSTDIGPGTVCDPAFNGRCRPPALPQTITATYAIYIKATGNPPPSTGTITDQSKYAVFQVDGEGGLNNQPNSNFRVYVSGLGNIKFISCSPKITVSANNGETVNFGAIPARNAAVGKIEKQVPFSIRADLTGQGQDCEKQTLMASFSTTYPTQDNQLILPESTSGFGILLSRADSPSTWISMNTPTELGYVNGSIVESNFLASLKWLSATPKVGKFNASANIDVTFK
ncbi:fimbrial protein [Pseudocitrobacter cyperus]|uniref:Fimbrial protein n=1 Tax=Pseudocitrobacter cyperus TaxID=3112843 RepID=A0ABV0HH60_9ENTR